MRLRFLLLILFVIVAVAGYRCLLFVDETEMVIVTQFGRPVDAYRLIDVEFTRERPLGHRYVGEVCASRIGTALQNALAVGDSH